jgi:hypothetical protein
MGKLLFPLLAVVLFACNNFGKTDDASGKSHPIDRPLYKMRYADGWTIDSSDEDFDMDSYFTLDSKSGNGFISMFVFNTGIDAKDAVQKQIDAHLSKTMKGGQVSKFQIWGNYKGEGANINGKLMGAFKGNINIFSFSTDTTGFIAVYQILDSEKEKDLPGVEQIKSSFKLK